MKQYLQRISATLFCALSWVPILAQNGYHVQIQVTNEKDSIAYLGYHFADKRFVLDTALLDENHIALFKGNQDLKPGLYFYYTPSSYLELILNEPVVKLRSTGPDLVKNLEIIESNENKLFHALQLFVSQKRAEFSAISQRLDSAQSDEEKESLRTRAKAIDEEVRAYQKEIFESHSETFAARMVGAMMSPQIPDSLNGESLEQDLARRKYFKEHYFDYFSVNDNGLLRTPLLHQKINEYLDDVVAPHPDSITIEIDRMLELVKNDNEVFRYLLVSLTGKYETSTVMGYDEVFVHLVDQYYLNGRADWVDAEIMQKMEERVATIRPNLIGNPAPPLVLNDTLFSEVSLYTDVRAEYVVLWFYDPDCGHCKTKTPVLYQAYEKLRNDGMEVLAINITTNQDRWKEYIRDNHYDWINLADSFSKTNFRYYYDVRSTPTLYVLDKNKKIIAKRLDAEQVEGFITDMIRRSSRE